MSTSNVRQQALQAVATTQHYLNRLDFQTEVLKDIFGANVFHEEVQKARLPKAIFKALQKTIKLGVPLDAGVADAVASAMKLAGDNPRTEALIRLALKEMAR